MEHSEDAQKGWLVQGHPGLLHHIQHLSSNMIPPLMMPFLLKKKNV